MKFSIGSRVEFASSCGKTIFHGVVKGYVSENYYALIADHTAKPPRLVRADRLKNPGWFKANDGEAA